MLNLWGAPQQAAPRSYGDPLLDMLAAHQAQTAWNIPSMYYAQNPMAFMSNQGPPVGINFQTPLTNSPLGAWSYGSGMEDIPVVNLPSVNTGVDAVAPAPIFGSPIFTPYNNGNMSTQQGGQIMGNRGTNPHSAIASGGAYLTPDQLGLNRPDAAPDWDENDPNEQPLLHFGQPQQPSGYLPEHRPVYPYGYDMGNGQNGQPYVPEDGTANAMQSYFNRRLQEEGGGGSF